MTEPNTQREEIIRFREKFGQFYVSIDSKTKAIRVVDIENGQKVNGEDGSLIECVASGDIEKHIATELTKARDETERHFLNQDANAHDEAVRKSYRQELRTKVERKLLEKRAQYREFGSQSIEGEISALEDLLTIISE